MRASIVAHESQPLPAAGYMLTLAQEPGVPDDLESLVSDHALQLQAWLGGGFQEGAAPHDELTQAAGAVEGYCAEVGLPLSGPGLEEF
jgi:hypothetical protein